ncbi:MAG: hypothetical protein QOF20_2589 [Acidimicrobiaceae bacterium]|nr:hypothetical protein [Acidimicrobiaceae bacterium]
MTESRAPLKSKAPPLESKAEQPTSDAAAYDVDPTRSLRATARGIGTVVGPTSAVTALLYYFGWTRTSIEAHQLGLDDSLLGYSTQDYLLRSMSSMFGPLVVGLLAGLAGIGFHSAVLAWVQRSGGARGHRNTDPHVRRVLRALTIVIAGLAGACLIVGAVGTRVRQPSSFVYVASPACVTVSIVLGVYAAALYRRFLTDTHGGEQAREQRGLRAVGATLIVLILVLSMFWNVSHYAAIKGRNLAATVENLLPTQPSVVVYSAKRLYLQSPVVETKLDPTDAAYKFAYSGLKLLFRSDHKYFLRPNNPGAVANIVLPDTLDIRIEFFPGQ